MIEMYPGTSGSTHGDKNEISPAAKAVKNETLSILSFDDDLCVRNRQAHQAPVDVRCCLEFYITYIKIEAARSCGPNGR